MQRSLLPVAAAWALLLGPAGPARAQGDAPAAAEAPAQAGERGASGGEAGAGDAPASAPGQEGARGLESPVGEGTPAPEEPSEPEPPAPSVRVAVVLMTTGELDPGIADGLSEVLIGGVAARGGVQIVGREMFQSQLGQGDARTLECIGSMACLGRVGVQLGVSEVIAGTLARRGDGWAFNLNRVDVRAGEIVGRVFREVAGDLGAVADALQGAVTEIYEPPARPATLLLRTNVTGAEISVDGAVLATWRGTDVRETGLEPGTHEVEVRAAGYRRWARRVSFREGEATYLDVTLVVEATESISPVVWLGLGAALLAVGGAVALGVVSQERLDTSAPRTQREVWSFYDARELEATFANVLIGTAIAASAVAVVGLFFPERRVSPAYEATLAPLPGGGLLAAVGGRW